MKHTPGPWVYTDKDSNGQAIVRNTNIEVATCWHHCVGSIATEMEANANLIAAAPDMLRALKMAKYVMDTNRRKIPLGGMDTEYQHVCDAIKKAEKEECR